MISKRNIASNIFLLLKHFVFHAKHFFGFKSIGVSNSLTGTYLTIVAFITIFTILQLSAAVVINKYVSTKLFSKIAGGLVFWLSIFGAVSVSSQHATLIVFFSWIPENLSSLITIGVMDKCFFEKDVSYVFDYSTIHHMWNLQSAFLLPFFSTWLFPGRH